MKIDGCGFYLNRHCILPHKHLCMHLCTLLYTYVCIRTSIDVFEYITCSYFQFLHRQIYVYVHAF